MVLWACLEEFSGRWSERYEGIKSQEYLPGAWGVSRKGQGSGKQESGLNRLGVLVSDIQDRLQAASRGYGKGLNSKELVQKEKCGNQQQVAGA